MNNLLDGIQTVENPELKFAKDSLEVLKVHTDMMRLHYKAMACHCEVMGMMSENAFSACVGQEPLFSNLHFTSVMKKWGLLDQKGNPVI